MDADQFEISPCHLYPFVKLSLEDFRCLSKLFVLKHSGVLFSIYSKHLNLLYHKIVYSLGIILLVGGIT